MSSPWAAASGRAAKASRLPYAFAWLLVASCACAQPAPKDFRQAAWGMTASQVRAAESQAPASVADKDGAALLRYDAVTFQGLMAQVVYILTRDRLVRAKYVFSADHDDANDFIGDFKAIEPLLTKQFGKPAESRAIWEDDSTQLEPKSYLDQDRASPANILASDPLVGLAVSLGHLRLYTLWIGPRTRILHALSGENHRITHQIEYRSVQLAPPEDAARPPAKAAQ